VQRKRQFKIFTHVTCRPSLSFFYLASLLAASSKKQPVLRADSDPLLEHEPPTGRRIRTAHIEQTPWRRDTSVTTLQPCVWDTYQLAAQLDEKSGRIILLVACLTMMPMSRCHVDSMSENELMKTEQKRPVYCEPARTSTGNRRFVLHLCLYMSHASFLTFLSVCPPFLSLSHSLFPFSFLSVSYFLIYIPQSSFLSLLFLVCFFSYFLSLYSSTFPSFFPYFYFHLSFYLPSSLSYLLSVFITSVFLSAFLSSFLCLFLSEANHT
jgi:hypothetical protein